MKKRMPYLIGAVLLLITEILIGAYAKDDFIRPYVGDVLVTPLLCCLVRCVYPEKLPWLAAGVFGFSVCVEFFQLIPKPALEGTLLGIMIGSSFAWWDIVCYAIGCAAFAVAESFRRRGKK